MAWKRNDNALEHAKKLIKEGKVVKDSDWSQAQASTDQENEFIDKDGWKTFGNWHLAYDPDQSEETKERYGFPFGDFKKVHRSALIAIKQRAGQYDDSKIKKASDELLDMIDK